MALLEQQDKEASQIIELKYCKRPVCKLNQEELFNVINVLIPKIHVITGWQLPAESAIVILIDQLAKHLNESYKLVNREEIEYAFRKYSGQIKDWGKNFNLGLFDEVMGIYLTERQKASEIEERIRNKPTPIATIEAPKHTDEENIEIARGLYRSMKSVDLIYPPAYQSLLNLGLVKLSKDDKVKYFTRAKAYYEALALQDPRLRKKDFTTDIQQRARKLVVKDYFDNEEKNI